MFQHCSCKEITSRIIEIWIKMKNVKTETIFNPSQENLEIVNSGLHEFNLAQLGEKFIYTYYKVLTLAKNQDGTDGGIHGDMGCDWLHIDTLWVDERWLSKAFTVLFNSRPAGLRRFTGPS